LRGACAVSLVSSRPGGVGAPPGDTTIPRQELANVDRRVLRRSRRSPWNGQIPETGRRKLTHDPRRARPDAVNLLPMFEQRLDTGPQGNRRDGAPEGAPAPYGRSSPDRTFRRWARPRGGPLGAPVSCTSVFGRSIPLAFLSGDRSRRSPRATTSGRRSVDWPASFRGATKSRARNP